MHKLESEISNFQLWTNFLDVRNKIGDALPSDQINYKCMECDKILNISKNGVTYLPESIEEPMSQLFLTYTVFSIEKHVEESNNCSGRSIQSNQHPGNIVFMFDDSDPKYFDTIKLDEVRYELRALVQSKEDNSKSILALYSREFFEDNSYLEFLTENFHTCINVKDDGDGMNDLMEQLVVDDETANHYRHLIPRQTGGGRKSNQEYTYQCQWCSVHDLRNPQRGKFRELKNYRYIFLFYYF